VTCTSTARAARLDRPAVLAALGCLFLLTAIPAPASAQLGNEAEEVAAEEAEEDTFLTIYGELNFPSRYAWRGLAWSNGLVLQPMLGVAAYGLDLWTAGNVPLTEKPNQGKFDEVDVGLTYTLEVPWFVLEATAQVWMYPNQEDAPTTGDLDVVLGVPIPLGESGGTLTVFTLQSIDIGSYPGAYYGEFGLRYGYDLSDYASLEASVLAGWASALFNETYIGPAITALSLVGASLSMTFYPLDFLYFRLHGQVTGLVDGELADAVDDPVIAAAGIAVGAEYGF
jgi:hypothetical protein